MNYLPIDDSVQSRGLVGLVDNLLPKFISEIYVNSGLYIKARVYQASKKKDYVPGIGETGNGNGKDKEKDDKGTGEIDPRNYEKIPPWIVPPSRDRPGKRQQ